MINLVEHKFFEYETKQEVVPLDIALKAVEEAANRSVDLKAAWEKMEKSLNDINDIVND